MAYKEDQYDMDGENSVDEEENIDMDDWVHIDGNKWDYGLIFGTSSI